MMDEEAGGKHGDRNQNERDPKGMTEAVDWMLVAGRVLCDPLLAGAIAQHGAEIILWSGGRFAGESILRRAGGLRLLLPAW
jgi:hypothetical protein